jgi:NAD(P)-dependent dehydrogenase (short-subunit alcohol dehydrogenase family)
MRVDLAGRIALVTGSAQGIGRATADLFVENGATVVYSDRSPQRPADLDGRHPYVPIDVSDEEAILAGVERVGAEVGPIDILVNNAGIGVNAEQRKPVDEFPVDAWHKLIAIDLTGVFLMSRAVVPHMKGKGGGRIVNIASVLGLVPMRLQSSYVAAKAGVVNLTRSMALELAQHNILVNGVAPGSTATEAWKTWIHSGDSAAQDAHARLMSHIPLARPATTRDIANGVLFLVAPESSYVTGHILAVDGGWTAGFARDF